jgi:undecaprenyl-diphosphatase
MLTYLQAIVLGLVQGVTELFPVSSLGHSVILPSLLGWHVDQASQYFLPFIVATHLATALVLLGFYFKDWVNIVKGFFRSIAARRVGEGDTYATLAWLIVIATVPAGILGLLFQKKLEILFSAPVLAAVLLMFNGVLLFGAEHVRRRASESGTGDERIAKLPYDRAGWVGISQAGALLPGLSRTGATMGSSLLSGLPHAEAARFSFLLATPIIFAAAILKLPVLIHASGHVLGTTLVGALVAAVAAYLSVRYLTRYFKTKTLMPFAVYCFIAGLVSIVIITF